MRHDRSAEEMIVGLHRISWEHSAYIQGLSQIIAPAHFRDLDFRSQNVIRIMKGTLNYIHKESLGVKRMTCEVIAERGWQADYPMEGDAAPIRSRWVGLGGDGACEVCRAKPSLDPEYDIEDYSSLVMTFLQNLWAGFVVLETYRQHQLRTIQESGFFGGGEDGYIADSFYQTCGRLVSLGLRCTGKPIQAHCAFWLHRDIKATKLEIALIRSYGLADISDVGHDKDWCPDCAARVVEMPVNIFELLMERSI